MNTLLRNAGARGATLPAGRAATRIRATPLIDHKCPFTIPAQDLADPRGPAGTPARERADPRRIATVGDHRDVHGACFRRGDGAVLLPLWLGLSGWDWRTKTAVTPVARRLRLEDADRRNAVTAHRFDDAGGVRAEAVALHEGIGTIEISDRLTVLEFAA